MTSLDRFSGENLKTVAKMLDDEDNWVRLNAAGSLPLFGKRAAPHLPALRECLISEDQGLKTRAQAAIIEIEQAEDKTKEEKEAVDGQKKIAEFLAAMLNSQPMGFYSPSQLVQDAKRHGVEVRAADVLVSDVNCTLEDLPHPPAVRLGLRMIAGLQAESMARIVVARHERVFDSAEDLARRARIEHHEMKGLAAADALRSKYVKSP